jgi:hypothetical protein
MSQITDSDVIHSWKREAIFDPFDSKETKKLV